MATVASETADSEQKSPSAKFQPLESEDEDAPPPTRLQIFLRRYECTNTRIALIIFFTILVILVIILSVIVNSKKAFDADSNNGSNSTKSDFIWGASTASYQIEGAIKQDGRLPSVWDTFCDETDKVYNNESGKIADNSYELYETDIKLLSDLGVSHYRFSLAWPRILPDGINVNMDAISHYYKVFNMLKQYNIEPIVTLFHWDLPQSVHDATNGGWINSTIIDYFKLYAKTVFQYFGNNSSLWITFNEPWTVCVEGYLSGVHAPGRCSDRDDCPDGGNSSTEPYLCGHNMLLSHAYAVDIFRNSTFNFNQNGSSKITMTLNIDYAFPASMRMADINATERSVIWGGAWFADPLYFGDYPSIMKAIVGPRLPSFTNFEKSLVKGSTDYFGLNHYTTKWHWYCSFEDFNTTEHTWENDMLSCSSAYNPYNGTLIGPFAASSWLNVVPSGFYELLHWVQDRYISTVGDSSHGIIVTENGVDAPNENETSPIDASINDDFRISYLSDYISGMFRARDEGVNVQGYCLWSLLDNFEWADGYSKRFGIHHVDFTSQDLTRTPKNSATWYKNFIENNP